MTGADLLAQGVRSLNGAGIPGAARDARHLLAHVLKVPPGRLTLFLPEPVPSEAVQVFEALIARRAAHEPVSHLTGRRQFYGRDFLVTRDVLDPRPETETLIEAALAVPFDRVLDLGTGSGCILLTLLSENERATGLGTDASAAALDVAFWNRNALRLTQRAALAQGDWWDAVATGARFDLIVSNPPYIAPADLAGLAPEVRDHEPRIALTDGVDGLSAYRAIAAGIAACAAPGARILLEIGPDQAAAVRAILETAGLSVQAVIRDLDGRDRVVSARFG